MPSRSRGGEIPSDAPETVPFPFRVTFDLLSEGDSLLVVFLDRLHLTTILVAFARNSLLGIRQWPKHTIPESVTNPSNTSPDREAFQYSLRAEEHSEANNTNPQRESDAASPLRSEATEVVVVRPTTTDYTR